MKTRLIVIFILLCQSLVGQKKHPQLKPASCESGSFSLTSEGENYKIIHYHEISPELESALLEDFNDNIFNDSINRWSRLVYKSDKNSFNVPTVPLTNIVFLKDKNLILCLSRITTSPYHILLYDLNGNLLFRRSLTAFEFKLTQNELLKLTQKHPDIQKCLSEQCVITQVDSSYYIELSRCLIKEIGRDTIVEMEGIEPNHLFPYMVGTIDEGRYKYQRYDYSYSDANPLDSLIMLDSKQPQSLVLNWYNGNKITIPLQSNCDINKVIANLKNSHNYK